jgi:hypothetical protein
MPDWRRWLARKLGKFEVVGSTPTLGSYGCDVPYRPLKETSPFSVALLAGPRGFEPRRRKYPRFDS